MQGKRTNRGQHRLAPGSKGEKERERKGSHGGGGVQAGNWPYMEEGDAMRQTIRRVAGLRYTPPSSKEAKDQPGQTTNKS
jgi:hypothetical protein